MKELPQHKTIKPLTTDTNERYRYQDQTLSAAIISDAQVKDLRKPVFKGIAQEKAYDGLSPQGVKEFIAWASSDASR